MKKKALLIDPHAKGSYHEVINASYLYLIAKNYSEVVYVTHKSAYDNAIKILAEYGLTVSNVTNVDAGAGDYSGNRLRGLKYLLFHRECSNMDVEYYKQAEDGVDVFYNNNILLGLNTLNKAVKKKGNRVFIMCHSEMNILEKGGDLMTRPEMVTRYFLKKFLRNPIDRRITMFVLGDWICDKVKRNTSKENQPRLRSLDHFYFRKATTGDNTVTLPGKNAFKIGIPSLINEGRGVGKLIDMLKRCGSNRGFDVYAIGRVVTDRSLDGTGLIKLNDSMQLLSTEQYIGYTSLMDAMIFFVDYNDFGASGGLLEAVWNEKIILSLKNAYAEYIFDKFGAMGVLFDDIQSISDYLSNHIDDLLANKETYLCNLKKAKEALKPENNISTFADFIKEK